MDMMDDTNIRKRQNDNVNKQHSKQREHCTTSKTDTLHNNIFHTILKVDVALTSQLGLCVNESSRFGYLRPVMKALEISCHGIPWFAFTILGILIARELSAVQFLMNLLLAQVVDVLVLLVLKSTVRRPRPSHNRDDMFADVVSVDRFSFPSGHSTRAVVLACIFIYKLELCWLLDGLVVCWAAAVCTSRVLLGRHHVLDVLCGVLSGIVEYKITEFFWLSENTCLTILHPLGLHK